MGSNTKIEWSDATWNPVSGCSKVSDGCTNCYGEAMARRFDKDWKPWTPQNAAHNVRLHPERLEQPLHWRKPRRIFVCSVSDLFHEQVPDEFIQEVFDTIKLADWHTYQILTKRAERMCHWVDEYERIEGSPFSLQAPNIQFGVTVESPKYTDRIDWLLKTPAAVRFVSIEPMLGPIDLTNITILKPDGYAPGVYLDALRGHVKGPDDMLPEKIDWVICGGESGPKARPMKPTWPREIRYQCQTAGVPYFFKQHGEWVNEYDFPFERLGCTWEGPEHRFDDGSMAYRVGKKAAGRELDGRTWEEMPDG